MPFRIFMLVLSIFSIGMFNACESPTPSGSEKKTLKAYQHQIKEQFVKANQRVLTKENDEMDYYQKSHHLAFTTTPAGTRYHVYKPSLKGDSIKDGDIVLINYTVSLLDGTVCYSSQTDGIKEIKVGMENVENGLHKTFSFLKSGDKALILIPSHLAHGLLGDTKKIPPQSPILYDIEIVDLKKSLKN